MRLRDKWPLQSPVNESGTTTPSGSSAPAPSSGGEERLPAGSKIPTERNDGVDETEASSESDLDWSVESEPISDDVDETPPKSEPKDEQPAAPKQGAKPGEEPKPQPQGDEQQPKSPQPPKEETPPPPKEETAEEKAARELRETQAREKRQKDLEEYYKLPDDLAARLATEPELVLPTLAAKVHQALELATQQMITQLVPQFLQQHTQLQAANEKAKSTFYDRWPSLKDYEPQVLQMGQMFRQLNPKATPEDSIERIGATVCAALGIQPDPKPGSGTPAPQQQQQRKAVGSPRPAGAAGARAPAPPPTENVFTEMANEFLEEDQTPS